jgi:predicted GNAT family N-acyltransferase
MDGTQPETAFQLTHCSWQDQHAALTAVRRAVFVVEQGVPELLELDEHDADSNHVLVRDAAGQPVGAGRLRPEGQIGRMAVLKDRRGQGIGTAILSSLLETARQQGHARVFLHAQMSAVSFYEKYGFVARGEVFEAAGIQHRHMEKTLD